MRYRIAFFMSFIANKFLKGYFNLINHYVIANLSKKGWKFYIEKTQIKGAIHYLSIIAPRWNTHAIIALTGNLQIDKTLKVEGLNALSSNCEWSMVIYEARKNKTNYHFSKVNHSEDEIEIVVKPGKYLVSYRLYEVKGAFPLPMLKIDNIPVEPRLVDSDIRKYPEYIFKKHGAFYRFIHRYLYLSLEGKISKDEKFIRREFLPVGNPETTFKYGFTKRGEKLIISESINDSKSNCLIYLTLYNRSSFPVYSKKLEFIEANKIEIDFSHEDTTYLIRIIPLVPLNKEIAVIECKTINISDNL